MKFVLNLAQSAGKIVAQHFGRVRRLTKTHAAASAEAVTDADRASQRFILAALRKRFADDGFIGEENDAGDAITCQNPAQGNRVWIIDPLDGTNNFCAGLGAFAVCIGLFEAGHPVLGVVYDVTRDLTYWAARGQGAWLNKQRLRAAASPLNDSSLLMLTSNCCDARGRPPAYAIRWISQTTWKLRMLGSAALESAQVAAGIAHGAVTVQGKLWDLAGQAAILLEAGAIVTDLAGKPIFPYATDGYSGGKVPFLAAGPKAHRQLLEEIARQS